MDTLCAARSTPVIVIVVRERQKRPKDAGKPKGTDLSAYPEDHLDAVAEELNDRPRKTLGYRKPSEKILELINTA